MTRNKPTKVAVCIATYRRPEDLKSLLFSLENIQLPQNTPVSLQFIIVDNDQNGSAGEIVSEMTAHLPGEVEYLVEPRQGVSFARNRGIALAETADWVALVDDDERVESDWLANLLWAAEYYRADVVQGPVIPEYAGEVPNWIDPGHYLLGKRQFEGELLSEARSGNLLIKNALLKEIEGPLDARLNRSGGGDTLLTRALKRKGAKLIHTNRARVYEKRPAERLSLKWMFKRNFRIGNTNALVCRYLDGGLGWRFYYAGMGLGRMVQCLVLCLAGLFKGRAEIYRGVLAAGLGLGNWAAVLGKTYEEYTPKKGQNVSD